MSNRPALAGRFLCVGCQNAGLFGLIPWCQGCLARWLLTFLKRKLTDGGHSGTPDEFNTFMNKAFMSGSIFAFFRTGFGLVVAAAVAAGGVSDLHAAEAASPRERISIDDGWRFTKGDPADNTVSLLYDVRPAPRNRGRGRGGSNAPPATVEVTNTPPPPPPAVIKNWILPSGDAFLKDQDHKHTMPPATNWDGVAYARPGFHDSSWAAVTLPH